MNSERTLVVLALAIATFAFAATLATADPTPPLSVNVQSSSSRDLDNLATQAVDARGGNVTQLNIAALTITQSWQGYYGLISGEITLDDASSNTFYNWSVTTVAGEVFATRNATIGWTNLTCANSSHVSQEEGQLGQNAADGDSVSNTFNLNSHAEFSVGSQTFTTNSCDTTNAFVNNASQTANWTQVLLHKNDSNANNIIYATLINDSTPGFDGGTYDFQLLVGENEHTGSIGVTTYYFWVELN